MNKIKFTDGCPNQCKYCYEPKQIKTYDPQIPITNELIQILDMNFLCNPRAKIILNRLPNANYEFVCGIDYRRLDQEIAFLLNRRGFIKIRWAWDYSFSQQKIHKKVLQMFLKAGYEPQDLSVFIIVNWKIPFIDCVRKLDLLKIWNLKVNDCCYDGGYDLAKPEHWDIQDIKRFRAMCRKHNQMIIHRLDPELAGGQILYNEFYKSRTNQLTLK